MKTVRINLKSVEDIKKFVAIITKYSCDTDVRCGRYVVDAKSILGILSLNLQRNMYLDIHSKDCDKMLEEIKDYLL